MAQENKQSLDEVIVAKISESSTLSAVRFTQACQVGVLFWGGQKKVYDKETGIDNFPPFFPNQRAQRDRSAEGGGDRDHRSYDAPGASPVDHGETGKDHSEEVRSGYDAYGPGDQERPII
jgi:hypothetical protein